jgi:hypothetical protein
MVHLIAISFNFQSFWLFKIDVLRALPLTNIFRLDLHASIKSYKFSLSIRPFSYLLPLGITLFRHLATHSSHIFEITVILRHFQYPAGNFFIKQSYIKSLSKPNSKVFFSTPISDSQKPSFICQNIIIKKYYFIAIWIIPLLWMHNSAKFFLFDRNHTERAGLRTSDATPAAKANTVIVFWIQTIIWFQNFDFRR